MADARSVRFAHNAIGELEERLARAEAERAGDLFIGVEGVYSMDGDLAPLDQLIRLKNEHGAYLLVDDAHGTGVMGAHGGGTAEHFGVELDVDITLGTFSKTFAVTGGFVTADKPVVDYLRLFARSYMFSASLPPAILAAVDAGLDLLEREPEITDRLRENTAYAVSAFRAIGIAVEGTTPILPLRVPEHLDIRAMGFELHRRGIFVNSVEFPAVPVTDQRFRVSIMATHTHADIDRLVAEIAAVWRMAGSLPPSPVPNRSLS
jgi:glycine C-acetyltransferase